ncbi:MAG: tetratricopeptide repeat protein [Gemmatimonadota bacterium]|nr:MAG: tetratricopeptide repeat protein [Gemmatimonadota bacterium]
MAEEETKKKNASELERWHRPLKDVDTVARAYLFRAAVILVPVGLFFSLVIGSLLARRGMPFPLGLLFGLGGISLLYGFIYFVFIGGTASFLGKIYFSAAPPLEKPQSWRGQALAVHGSHAEAQKAYEEEAARYPNDPGPCLRAAALCLEEMDDPENAIAWYLRARKAEGLPRETDEYICVRIADICESIGDDSRARVELRRLLERHPDSQYAAAARGRLAILKARQVEEHETGDSSQS